MCGVVRVFLIARVALVVLCWCRLFVFVCLCFVFVALLFCVLCLLMFVPFGVVCCLLGGVIGSLALFAQVNQYSSWIKLMWGWAP